MWRPLVGEPPLRAEGWAGPGDRGSRTVGLMSARGGGGEELVVDPLERLRTRRSAKWRTHPPDVLPLTIAEMDYTLAPAVSEVLQQAVTRSDTGYAVAVPELGQALAAFARGRWSWQVDRRR